MEENNINRWNTYSIDKLKKLQYLAVMAQKYEIASKIRNIRINKEKYEKGK